MSKIVLDEESVRYFAHGELDGYTHVDTIIDYEAGYKDLAPAETICQRDSDKTYWSLCWEYYTSHYGMGESMYNDETINQVEKQVETKTITVERWVCV